MRRKHPWTFILFIILVLLYVFFIYYLSSRSHFFSQKTQLHDSHQDKLTTNDKRKRKTKEPTPKKSLVVFVLGSKANQGVDRLVTLLGFKKYSFLFFFHEESDQWQKYSWYHHVSKIYAIGQMKFWFFKRYLPSSLVLSYEFLLLIDHDAFILFEEHHVFNPEQYFDIQRDHMIFIAQPGILQMGRGSDHYDCRHRGESLLRWTGFVEGGPFVSMYTFIWPMIYDYIQDDLITGYGVDLSWCPHLLLIFNMTRDLTPFYDRKDIRQQWRRWDGGKQLLPGGHVCAVIDAQPIVHGDTKTARSKFENFDGKALHELSVYRGRFPHHFKLVDDYVLEKIWP